MEKVNGYDKFPIVDSPKTSSSCRPGWKCLFVILISILIAISVSIVVLNVTVWNPKQWASMYSYCRPDPLRNQMETYQLQSQVPSLWMMADQTDCGPAMLDIPGTKQNARSYVECVKICEKIVECNAVTYWTMTYDRDNTNCFPKYSHEKAAPSDCSQCSVRTRPPPLPFTPFDVSMFDNDMGTVFPRDIAEDTAPFKQTFCSVFCTALENCKYFSFNSKTGLCHLASGNIGQRKQKMEGIGYKCLTDGAEGNFQIKHSESRNNSTVQNGTKLIQ